MSVQLFDTAPEAATDTDQHRTRSTPYVTHLRHSNWPGFHQRTRLLASWKPGLPRQAQESAKNIISSREGMLAVETCISINAKNYICVSVLALRGQLQAKRAHATKCFITPVVSLKSTPGAEKRKDEKEKRRNRQPTPKRWHARVGWSG